MMLEKTNENKTLTVNAYFSQDDYFYGEYDESNFDVLCKISELEWETHKMTIPILKDNYQKSYELYEILNENGSLYTIIKG